MNHITEFQLAAEASLGVPDNDVYEMARRGGIYDDNINIMRQRFPGYVVKAPSRTLVRAQEVAVPQINPTMRGQRKMILWLCPIFWCGVKACKDHPSHAACKVEPQQDLLKN